jgi:hypothetical protein
MDPKFNGNWSANEIEMVRSIIASHDANSIGTNNRNAKHYGIVDELQARFPRKDKRQVIDLYVDLVVEMVNAIAMSSNRLPMMVSNDLVVDNFGVMVENPGMHGMDVSHGYLTDEMKAKRMVEEQHHMKVVVPQQDKQRARRFWTLEEHRYVIDLCTTLEILVFFHVNY